MPEQILEFRPAPGRIEVCGGEKPTHIGIEVLEADVQHGEREQKVWHRQPDEPEKGEQVVENRVLADRRVDADGQGQQPRKDECRERHGQRQWQSVANHLHDGPVVLHRHAEVALRDQPDPAQILDVHGLVEPVLRAQVGRLLRRDDGARSGELRNVGVHVVARREMNDDE